MAESLVTQLQRRLKPGYHVRRIYDNKFGVINPQGDILTDGGTSLYFQDREPQGGRFKENLFSALRRNGAIADPPKRSPERKPARKVKNDAPKNAVIVAQETLRDTYATPRERTLARNYLSLLEAHNTVGRLAQRLGQRLRELEK